MSTNQNSWTILIDNILNDKPSIYIRCHVCFSHRKFFLFLFCVHVRVVIYPRKITKQTKLFS